MTDLVCLVADRNMEAVVAAVLGRPESLGIRPIDFEVIVHPGRDPGCFARSADLLAGYRSEAQHALVILDARWQGAPSHSACELERALEHTLRSSGFGDWARAIVIEPELEAWIFSGSPNVQLVLGWGKRRPGLQATLRSRGMWRENRGKPEDPKAAVEWALRQAKKPRSSAVYAQLARKVSLRRCQDRSFLRLVAMLKEWFGDLCSATEQV